MSDQPYSNRELDAKFEGIHEKLDENKNMIMTELREIKADVRHTNGKARKIIICSEPLAGVIIDMNYNNWHDVIGLLVSLH
jgi:hypothetical protein